jgi:hypothetical protein
VEESRRTALMRRVEQLESRTRVSEAAGYALGMRLPSGEELVILPMAEPAPGRWRARPGPPSRAGGGG